MGKRQISDLALNVALEVIILLLICSICLSISASVYSIYQQLRQRQLAAGLLLWALQAGYMD